MNSARPRLLVAGCGDLGIRLARRLPDWHMTGLRRNVRKLPSSIRPLAVDLSDAASLSRVDRDWDAVVYTATPGARDEEAYRTAYVDGLQRLLERVRAPRLVFVSSTAVFGQDRGEWVDEASETAPVAFNGRILLEAEACAQAAGGTVVRFSGIYGPGRTWLLRQARKGSVACRRDPPQWTNRIHAEDCAGVLAHLLALESPPALVLASDLEPAPRWDVLSWLTDRLGVPGPVEPEVEDQPVAQGKRVAPTRLQENGYNFEYPDFRSGYAEMIAQENRHADE